MTAMASFYSFGKLFILKIEFYTRFYILLLIVVIYYLVLDKSLLIIPSDYIYYYEFYINY